MSRTRKPPARKPPAPKAPADWPEALDRFDGHLAEMERSPHTRRCYRADLEDFGGWYHHRFQELPSLPLIQPAELREYKHHQRETLKLEVNTVNRRLATLRSLLKWAEREGFAPEVRGPKGLRQTAQPPRWLTASEQRKLLRVADRYGSMRESAWMRLMLHTGLRVDELAALTWDDVEVRDRSGQLTVRKGKGRKQRVIPLNSEARAALLKLEECNYLGLPTVVNGQRGSFTPRGFQDRLQKLARRAGLPPITPHDLRHTFGHELAVAGVAIQEIADLMGHESLETTRRYVQPGQEDLAASVQKLAGGPEEED